MVDKIKNTTEAIDAKGKYCCTITFTTNKNLNKVFSERKFLRIITLNNMITKHNNIFIIREKDDIEADVSELNLECLLESKVKETNQKLQEEVKLLRDENKILKNQLAKIKNILA